MLGLLSGPPGFTCWIYFAPVFSLIYCWVIIFALSLFYILIYMFHEMMHWYVRGISCKRNIYVSWSISELRVRLVHRLTGLSPPVKNTDYSKAVLLFWIINVISVLFCYAFMYVCLLMPCGHLRGKGLPLGSRLWCLNVKLSLSLGILGQMRCLIVSIHDLYPFLCFIMECLFD